MISKVRPRAAARSTTVDVPSRAMSQFRVGNAIYNPRPFARTDSMGPLWSKRMKNFSSVLTSCLRTDARPIWSYAIAVTNEVVPPVRHIVHRGWGAALGGRGRR